ncbi:MAG TPA: hypothetical protein VGL70_17070 [Candidatus Binatia bacterium]|jgi:hypothetical protein
MTKKEAGLQLRAALVLCSPEQASAVNDILEIGAGDIAPPKDATLSGPAEVPVERRHSYDNLMDAVYGCRPDSGGEEWQPVHAGDWESVLATLVIEGAWDKIEQVAKELRDEDTEEQRAARRAMRG